MNILSQISDAMQVVLKETANNIARKAGFIKRQRKLNGSDFVQTLVFGWLSNPDSTIEELAQTTAWKCLYGGITAMYWEEQHQSTFIIQPIMVIL